MDHYLEKNNNLYFPHKHSFYHLIYFTKGAGQHSIDFVKFPVQEGMIYFMVPGQVHEWHFEGNPEGFIINFSEQYLNSFVADALFLEQFSFFSGDVYEQVIVTKEHIRTAIGNIFIAVLKEYHASSVNKDEMVKTLLIQLFITIKRSTDISEKLQPNYNSVVMKNFKKLIELRYKQKKLTKDYAALLHMTPNHLNALAKNFTGRSAGEIIRDRVILEAKRLLINASYTIAEISSELNFSDNSYFSKFFKKYTGLSPETFRSKSQS